MYDVWSDSFQLQTQKEAVAYATASWFFGATNRIRTYDPLIFEETIVACENSPEVWHLLLTPLNKKSYNHAVEGYFFRQILEIFIE